METAKYTRKPLKQRFKDGLGGYAFIAIPMLIIIIFTFIPVFFTIYLSFFKRMTLSGEMTFRGLDNYRRLFTDELFFLALKNTLGISIIVVPCQTFLAILMAYVLNQNIKFERGFRLVYFLPTLTSTVAITMIFQYLFSYNGPITEFLMGIGYLDERVNLLEDPSFVLNIINVMNIWSTAPVYMTIYFARLRSLSKEVYEAADIDGVNAVQRFFRITVPQLNPITIYALLTGIIGTLQTFDKAYIISGGTGGPNNATLTVSLLIYNTGFDAALNGMGYASTMALALAVVIFTITFVVRKFFNEDEYKY